MFVEFIKYIIENFVIKGYCDIDIKILQGEPVKIATDGNRSELPTENLGVGYLEPTIQDISNLTDTLNSQVTGKHPLFKQQNIGIEDIQKDPKRGIRGKFRLPSPTGGAALRVDFSARMTTAGPMLNLRFTDYPKMHEFPDISELK
jgi:hypothetical protein